MKQVVFLGDGMADLPLAQLDNKTPLAVADKPFMDKIARTGLAGLIQTVPPGLEPGSDTANLSVMGYDPLRYYTGRSPLEAISMGIDLKPEDVAFRLNLVTLSANGAGETMQDYSAGEITSTEAAQIIDSLKRHLADENWQFYAGKSYRHCLVWRHGSTDMTLTPPHDILTQATKPHLPRGNQAAPIKQLMQKARTILAEHPVNRARLARNLNPANGIWIWGQGVKPQLPNLLDQLDLKGSVITAVDLIQGIGICAGMKVVTVPGATGTIDTNYAGKAAAAIEELKSGQNFIYLHVEAPDECGHHADLAGKIKSIELIDREIIGPVWDFLSQWRRTTGEEYRVMVLPDHPTPIDLRTHTSDPVPFAVFGSDKRDLVPATGYDEQKCAATNLYLQQGHQLLERFTRSGFNDLII